MYVLFIYLFISMYITYTISYLHIDARVQHRHTDTTYMHIKKERTILLFFLQVRCNNIIINSN